MKNYLNTNSKLKKDDIYKFSLPVKSTCIGADKCLAYCYASKGFYKIFEKKVNAVRDKNFELSKSDEFVQVIVTEIVKRKIRIIRIHDSGDFYSQKYLDKWSRIASLLPDVKFYAYTKSLTLDFEGFTSLPNTKIIQSFGGKHDLKIDMNKPHALILQTVKTLKLMGYEDCSKSDLVALETTNNKIGLIAH